eukprot:snap_masked-scaffold_13-processed-gene-3.44-mRNA-1 protein AED:1.00 eAED:1.00 QI:0/0/0/0/1/1/2/0/76
MIKQLKVADMGNFSASFIPHPDFAIANQSEIARIQRLTSCVKGHIEREDGVDLSFDYQKERKVTLNRPSLQKKTVK